MNSKGEEYRSHIVFKKINELSEFYESLSNSTSSFLYPGTNVILNLDTHVFSSIKETIDSIYEILLKGRINDAYALLRKYLDSTLINIYSGIYLKDNFRIERYINEPKYTYLEEHINGWVTGKTQLPNYRGISNYIRNSVSLMPITNLLYKDKLYSGIRERCNDHTHYNYYYALMLNIGDLYLTDRLKHLDIFLNDMTAGFIQHFAYLFYLKDEYLMSNDYVDYLDAGLQPPIESQYWVAPFIQNIFDEWIKTNRPDIAEEIKSRTSMHLK